MKRTIIFVVAILFLRSGYAQIPGLEAKNWYFGMGTDGLVFDVSLNPIKVSNKMNGVGFEGMVVVSDPLTGNLLFYSDGQTVVTSTHVTMFNGTGLFGHMSGAQTVQCLPMPGVPGKYYLLTNGAWDVGSAFLYYSVVDFTDLLYPLGKVTNKNTLISNQNYSQGNKLISKPGTNDYWWVGHIINSNQYKVIFISSGGFSPPVTYTFPAMPIGDSYAMAHSPLSNKLAVTGLNLTGFGSLGVILMDFDSNTGVLSGPVQIETAPAGCGNFSPDGSKLYFLKSAAGLFRLHQYDLSNSVLTNMNTCCYAHDIKTAQNGKMYHIHTYNNTDPIAVINFPNLSAVGNACGYNASAGIVGLFNGEVRRFPEFVITPTAPVLPMKFVDFIAKEKSGEVELIWKTAQECGEGNFEIERGNGIDAFYKIGNIGDNHSSNYYYSDPETNKDDYSYRIKYTDSNGKNIYSEVRTIGLDPSTKMNISLFPNPCSGSINMSFENPEVEEVQISIFDVFGKNIFQTTTVQSPVNFDLKDLGNGIYFVQFTKAGKKVFGKFQVDR